MRKARSTYCIVAMASPFRFSLHRRPIRCSTASNFPGLSLTARCQYCSASFFLFIAIRVAAKLVIASTCLKRVSCWNLRTRCLKHTSNQYLISSSTTRTLWDSRLRHKLRSRQEASLLSKTRHSLRIVSLTYLEQREHSGQNNDLVLGLS